MGFIRPCFNFAHFAQLTMGEFKTRANTVSHIEYIIVYIVPAWANSKLVETEVIPTRGQNKGRVNIFCFTVYIMPHWTHAFLWQFLYSSGTTRDNFDGKKVLRLEYEAYIPMAEKKMKEICQLIRDKWTVHSTAMVHRIG